MVTNDHKIYELVLPLLAEDASWTRIDHLSLADIF